MSGDHDHQRSGATTRALTIGIALNLAFVAVEAFFGWKVDSLALLAAPCRFRVRGERLAPGPARDVQWI